VLVNAQVSSGQTIPEYPGWPSDRLGIFLLFV